MTLFVNFKSVSRELVHTTGCDLLLKAFGHPCSKLYILCFQ